MYWRQEYDLRNELTINAMRRNRFKQVMQFFHIANNEEIDNDRYFKVRSIISHLDLVFKKFNSYTKYISYTKYSIDETMVPYYGRHMGQSNTLKENQLGLYLKFGLLHQQMDICYILNHTAGQTPF